MLVKKKQRLEYEKYLSFAANAKQDFKNVDLKNFTNDQILKFAVAHSSQTYL